jgi:hypothetical protein
MRSNCERSNDNYVYNERKHIIYITGTHKKQKGRTSMTKRKKKKRNSNLLENKY